MSAQPSGADPADALNAFQPVLRGVEADIASVYLARLEGLFMPDALGLHDGLPKAGSFLARIGKPEFWACALCKKDQQRYSPATQLYLADRFPGGRAMDFRAYSQLWGRSFFAARYDLESARDLLLLFLDQNLSILKDLYVLEQPHNQDLAPDVHAVTRCLAAPSNALLFVGDRFAHWALNDWLPFHLRNVCCRAFLAEEEAFTEDCPHTALPGATVSCACQ